MNMDNNEKMDESCKNFVDELRGLISHYQNEIPTPVIMFMIMESCSIFAMMEYGNFKKAKSLLKDSLKAGWENNEKKIKELLDKIR